MRTGGVALLVLTLSLAGIRLVYGNAGADRSIVLPPVLAFDGQLSGDDADATGAPPTSGVTVPGTEPAVMPSMPIPPTLPTGESLRARVMARLASGDIDLVGVMTVDGSDEEFDDFEAVTGRKPDVIQLSVGWELDRFDPSFITRITDRGALPSLSWEPWDYRPDDVDQPDYALARLIDGTYDSYIDEWAHGLAASGQPVLFRFAHEANGDWYPWAESVNGNSPGEYVAAWRYIHDRFTQAGADNVIWMWSPNVNAWGLWPMAPVYPGDEYIDLVGLVGYWGHFDETPTQPGSFASVFGASITEIEALTAKPILIAETGASDQGGFKAAWMADFMREVAARREVIGFIWFEALKEDDWRVDSTPESLAVFLQGLELPAFATTAPADAAGG